MLATGGTFVRAPKDGAIASLTHDYAVVFAFPGFFEPVDNLPTLNRVNAGAAVPMKFSLGGDQGLDVFAAGYPASQTIPCDSTAPVDELEATTTAGSSSLSYDALLDRYSYVWKTAKAWSGTCRQFVAKLADGTEHRAARRLSHYFAKPS